MATSVQFATLPPKLKRTITLDSGFDNIASPTGGIYNTRNISHQSLERRWAAKTPTKIKFDDPPTQERDEDPGLRNEADFKQRQVFKGRMLFFLAYQSIGVIYGDIGTSPLYVFSGTFSADPSYIDLLGALSLILWSLIMMVTLKYVIVILRADNNGEGGTFSTYSLLARFAHITNRDPREESLIKMERFKTGDIHRHTREVRSIIERSRFARGLLQLMGVLAVSMVMSDGVLTPAQSVLGAVQGAEVVNPNLSKAAIIGTTCGILVLLFLIQPFGTTKIAVVFAPVIIVWLAMNAAFGIYNLVKFDHSVLKAFSPYFAFSYLVRNKTDGWRSLGGILLSFTGVEALFADLGAFSRRAIQLSWFCFTFPCLLLTYVGQAAYISKNPSAWSNPVFNAAPPGTLYFSLIIAVLAAIVASQAIITATFQLMAQIMKLSFFPQIKVVHTSDKFHGQLYVPMLNWLMMVGTVLVAAIYNNTTSLGNAYGVCVMFVTFFDTCMVSLAALIVWRIKPYYVALPWLTIAAMDGTFLSSALTKVPDGAWFTLALSFILGSLFILWRYGKEKQWAAEAEDRHPTTHFVRKNPEGGVELTKQFGGTEITTIKGFGVFFDKAGETAPIIFSQFVTKLTALPEVMVFFHLRPLEQPTVAPEDRYTVSKLAVPNCYRLVVRHGYMDEVVTPDLAGLIVEKVRDFIVTRSASAANYNSPEARAQREAAAKAGPSNEKASTSDDSDDDDESDTDNVSTTLGRLESAFSHQVLYIIGKEQMRIDKSKPIWRRFLLKFFLFIRENTRTKMAYLNVPMEKVVEVGFVKDV